MWRKGFCIVILDINFKNGWKLSTDLDQFMVNLIKSNLKLKLTFLGGTESLSPVFYPGQLNNNLLGGDVLEDVCVSSRMN